MKSLGKRRTRRNRRRRTRKVGGYFSRRGDILHTLAKGKHLEKILKEMVVILRPSTFEVFQSKTFEFRDVNERLLEKASAPEHFGQTTQADLDNYWRVYEEWRDLLDHPRFSVDAARLREIGAYDDTRRPKHRLYQLFNSTEKWVDEVVKPEDHDPVLNERNRVEHESLLQQARQRRRHRERAIQELARETARETQRRIDSRLPPPHPVSVPLTLDLPHTLNLPPLHSLARTRYD